MRETLWLFIILKIKYNFGIKVLKRKSELLISFKIKNEIYRGKYERKNIDNRR